MCSCGKKWGGLRACAGRKRTCVSKVSFTRRLDTNIIKILQDYAFVTGTSDTEALSTAILSQANNYKNRIGKMIKIAIPTSKGKLCSHFGKCDCFSFIEVDKASKKVLSLNERVPEEGISCQCASWLAAEGVNLVIAGGMGQKPYDIFQRNGVEIVTGCLELPIDRIVDNYLNGSLQSGTNPCNHDHASNEGGLSPDQSGCKSRCNHHNHH